MSLLHCSIFPTDRVGSFYIEVNASGGGSNLPSQSGDTSQQLCSIYDVHVISSYYAQIRYSQITMQCKCVHKHPGSELKTSHHCVTVASRIYTPLRV